LVTQNEYDGQGSAKKKKKKEKEEVEEVEDIESDEKDNASEETPPDSPVGGRDKVNQEEEGEEGNKKYKGEVTLPKDPLIEFETSNKRKVSPQKHVLQKKTRANNPQSHNVLTVDDIQLIVTALKEALENIL
jgi:hypothetical protein